MWPCWRQQQHSDMLYVERYDLPAAVPPSPEVRPRPSTLNALALRPCEPVSLILLAAVCAGSDDSVSCCRCCRETWEQAGALACR